MGIVMMGHPLSWCRRSFLCLISVVLCVLPQSGCPLWSPGIITEKRLSSDLEKTCFDSFFLDDVTGFRQFSHLEESKERSQRA